MSLDLFSLLLILALLVAFAGLLLGLWAATRAGRVITTPESDLRAIRAYYSQFQSLVGTTTERMKGHDVLVREINSRLLAAEDSGETLSPEVMIRASAELLAANAELREALAQAQSEVDFYAKQAAASLQNSRTDALTCLANRRAFDDSLAACHAAWLIDNKPVTLLLIDVDHFKRFNDTHGHQVGDDVLRGVAGILSGVARQHHCVARYGGEEFAVIMTAVELERAKEAARAICEAVAAGAFYSHDKKLSVTISIGLAELATARDTTALVNFADRALYAAKENGRNRVYYCDGQQCIPVSACASDLSALENRSPPKAVQPVEVKPENPQDRRRCPRRPFPFMQQVARLQAGSFPGPDEFVRVQFHELSVSGCSFFLQTAPRAKTYVVALGVPPNPVYVLAQVVYSVRQEQGTAVRYLVGCEFTTRINATAVFKDRERSNTLDAADLFMLA